MIGAARASAIDLEPPRKYPVEGGELRFEASAPKVLAELPFDREGVNVETAVTPHYTLYADLDSIDYAERGSYFRYRIYVEPRPTGEVEAFTVKAMPVGSFLPQMGDIQFTLRGPTVEQGTIRLPVFSLGEPKYLKSPEWTTAEEVELPSGKAIRIPLENLLTLPVKVLEIQQPDAIGLWRQATLKQAGTGGLKPFQIGPGVKSKDLLLLDLQPGPQAIFKALFPRARDGEHDRVQASLICALPWENLPRQTLTLAVPVRFVPWPPILFLSVALGALLGSAIPVLLDSRRRTNWWRAFLVSLLVAFVAELIAMVLVQLNSRLQLLGIEVDPFQLLPASLIGILMGLMGFKSLTYLEHFLPAGGAP